VGAEREPPRGARWRGLRHGAAGGVRRRRAHRCRSPLPRGGRRGWLFDPGRGGGGPVQAPIEDTADDRWRETIAVNLTRAFLCSRAACGQMRARGGGRIVLVSSLSGVYATEKFPGLIAYNASKHGVVGLMEGLAVEGRPHGIWAISISPGAVDTEMLHVANPDL